MTEGWRSTLARWAGEAPVYATAAALFAGYAVLLAAHGVYPTGGPVAVNAQLFALTLLGFVAFDAGAQLWRHRPAGPIGHLRARYGAPSFAWRLLAGLPLLAMAIVLLPFFSKMKAAIPLFAEYSWDAAFIRWDRALFFGHDAWEVLQPLLGYPIVTATLAVLYHAWFLLLYAGVLYFIVARIDPTVRRRFFLTYVLAWTLVGGALAIGLASVGPCFVGPLLGDRTFDAQMAYLNTANREYPVMVLPVQQMLLDWYREDTSGLGSGITAMPSMHVAIAFLFWLAMRHVDRPAGVAFGMFFVVIWVGSVHLAYHYAVDGLVSVIVVAALWRLSAVVFAAWDRRLAQPARRTNTVPAE